MVRQILVIFMLFFAVLSCTRKSDMPLNSVQFPLRMNIKTLDPARTSDEGSEEAVPNIYEGLLQYHYLKRPLTPVPQLAEGMPEVSKDGLTVTIKIKPGVKFQDSEAFPGGKGREVTAQDFIYSWKRVADPATQSESYWIFEPIKGLNEWRDKMAKKEVSYDTPVEGLQAPDPHTLVIKFNNPYYQLNYVLTMSPTKVVPREAVEKYGAEFMNHPVGTGPYMLEKWIRGNRLVMTKNPTYRGDTYPTEGEASDKDNGLLADAGKPLPFADKIAILELPEDQPRWLNMMKGEVDFAGIPKDSYDGAIENNKLREPLVKKGIKLHIYPYPDCVYTGFNIKDPILGKNVNLRKALNLVMDRKGFIEKFYNGRAIPAESPIPPDVDGYDPEYKNPYLKNDIELAKEYMKKAGYPDGKGLPPLEVSTSSSTTTRQMAEFIGQEYAKIGVKLNINTNSWPQFLERLRTSKAQMFDLSWGLDYPDAQNVLQLFYSKNVSPGPNSSNFVNKDFDAAYEASLKLPPGPERTKLYKKMRDIFVEQMPWSPHAHRLGYMVYHNWLYNLKMHQTLHGFYKYLRVDTEKKKASKDTL